MPCACENSGVARAQVPLYSLDRPAAAHAAPLERRCGPAAPSTGRPSADAGHIAQGAHQAMGRGKPQAVCPMQGRPGWHK
jgi:hypothetical protein